MARGSRVTKAGDGVWSEFVGAQRRQGHGADGGVSRWSEATRLLPPRPWYVPRLASLVFLLSEGCLLVSFKVCGLLRNKLPKETSKHPFAQ